MEWDTWTPVRHVNALRNLYEAEQRPELLLTHGRKDLRDALDTLASLLERDIGEQACLEEIAGIVLTARLNGIDHVSVEFLESMLEDTLGRTAGEILADGQKSDGLDRASEIVQLETERLREEHANQ